MRLIQFLFSIFVIVGFGFGILARLGQAKLKLKIFGKVVDEVKKWDEE